MPIHWNRLNRKTHYWGAIICAVPVLIIILTGILLLLKKNFDWIQPPTQKGTSEVPMLSYEDLLARAKSVPEAGIVSWDDIDRLDVRPGKGLIKVVAKNRWEIQLDQGTGEVLQVAYRRSDLIETLHDGTFFHENAKLWIFLPSAVTLLVLWITGIWLFVVPLLMKARRRPKAG
jgi:uncharacterized iron-regulated membrane protein